MDEAWKGYLACQQHGFDSSITSTISELRIGLELVSILKFGGGRILGVCGEAAHPQNAVLQ